MKTLSVVVPALDEETNLPTVMGSVPLTALNAIGWDVEVLVVDNGSTDRTAEVARSLGARVVPQPVRGYGNAYRKGFETAVGEVIATGDADCTYPFDALPLLLKILEDEEIDFMTTDRLHRDNRGAMKPSHMAANHVLSGLSRMLFRNSIRDSQSGMWIFRRHVWSAIDVRSTGMAFSQEIKNAATLAGFRYSEVPIEYRPRGGEVKLHPVADGFGNIRQLFEHRLRNVSRPARVAGAGGFPAPRKPAAAAEPDSQAYKGV